MRKICVRFRLFVFDGPRLARQNERIRLRQRPERVQRLERVSRGPLFVYRVMFLRDVTRDTPPAYDCRKPKGREAGCIKPPASYCSLLAVMFQSRLQAAFVASLCAQDLRSRKPGPSIAPAHIILLLMASGSASSQRIEHPYGRQLGTLLHGGSHGAEHYSTKCCVKSRKSATSGRRQPWLRGTSAPGKDHVYTCSQSNRVPGITVLAHAGDQLRQVLHRRDVVQARAAPVVIACADSKKIDRLQSRASTGRSWVKIETL